MPARRLRWGTAWLVVRALPVVVLAPLLLIIGLVVSRQGGLLRGPDPAAALQRQQRLREVVGAAERAAPVYPGAERLTEQWGTNRGETSPTLQVCWHAAVSLETVLTFYRQALDDRARSGWRVRGVTTAGDALGAERGQVRLLVYDPTVGVAVGPSCPSGTTYAVSLVAFNRPPGADPARSNG